MAKKDAFIAKLTDDEFSWVTHSITRELKQHKYLKTKSAQREKILKSIDDKSRITVVFEGRYHISFTRLELRLVQTLVDTRLKAITNITIPAYQSRIERNPDKREYYEGYIKVGEQVVVGLTGLLAKLRELIP